MSYTTQTLSSPEEETDVTRFLSPFARARFDAWRRGELAGEEPPEETVEVQPRSKIKDVPKRPRTTITAAHIEGVRLRTMKGMSVAEIAREVGLGSRTIYDIKKRMARHG